MCQRLNTCESYNFYFCIFISGGPEKNWNTLYLTIASTICIVCQWYLVHDIIWLIAFCGENCMHIGQTLFKWQRIKDHMSKNAMPESQVSVTYLFQLRRWSMWPPICSHTALLFEWPDWLPDFFQSNFLPLFPNFLLQIVLCEFWCASFVDLVGIPNSVIHGV